MSLEAKKDKKTGIYYAKGTVAGKRIRKSLKTSDPKIARELVRRMEADAWQAGDAKEVVTFEMAALAYMQADGESRFLAPLIVHFQGRPIDEIQPGEIQDAARAIYKSRKPATWNRNAITPAQAVINFAAERGWCHPLRVPRFKAEKVERKAATEEWLRAFMEHAPENIAALALFMFTTGARISEALRVTREDIAGRQVSMTTKTGPRVALLTREMRLVIESLPDEGPLFGFTSRSSVYNHWYGICDKAGIERLPPHQAGRHAFATEMIVRKGVDAKTTATLGGWKSPRLLMENYTHPEKLMEVIDDAFGAPKPELKGSALNNGGGKPAANSKKK